MITECTRRVWWLSLAGFLLVGLTMPAHLHAQSQKLSGRPLADVLTELASRGVNVVFSSDLVRPEMRVLAEPRSQNPRRMLEEILRPHGLTIREAAKGTLTIARARTPRRPERESSATVGTIRGRLVEARTGEALVSGLVQVESTAQQAQSDVDGRFEIAAVPTGSQRLLVSMVGYALVRRDVEVPASGTLEIEIPLSEGAGSFVESVTVTAPTFRNAESGVASQSVLGSRDLLALRGAVADDPVRAVQTLPEVMASDDYKAEFAVRGQGLQHLAFSLDGIDSRLLFHTVRGVEDTGSLALVNSDILDSAAIVAGSRPQRMHSNLGAAVDFTTRDGAADRLRVRGLLSATAASTVWEGPAGSSASWLVAARQSYLDWVLRKVDPETTGTFGFTDFQGKLTWTPAPKHSVRALLVTGRSMLHENEDPGLNSLDEAAHYVGAASVRWRYTPSERLAVSQQLYAVAAGYANRTPTGAAREEGSDLDLVWRGGLEWTHARGRVEAGGQAQHIDAVRRSTQFTTLGPFTTLDVSGRTTNGAAWLHTNWTLAPGLVVSPGVRVDAWGMLNTAAVSSWLLAEWQATPSLRWRGGVSAPRQSPLVEQAELAREGARLEPERAHAWDVGVERTIGDAWRASLNVYRRDERDLLRLVGGEPRILQGSIFRPSFTLTPTGLILQRPHWENAMTGQAHGVGVTLERRVTNGLSGWIAYSNDRTTITDQTWGETFPGDFDQHHTFNAYGIYRWSARTALSARWRIGSNFPMPGYYREVADGIVVLSSERNQLRLPLYSRLDVRADRAFTFRGSRLTLFVEVLNLTNRSNIGPGDPDINVVNGRVRGLFDDLFPLLPSAGLIVEF